MKRFIAAVLFLFAFGVQAEDKMYLHGLSYHYHNRNPSQNEVNWGLSYKKWDWHTGLYYNTHRKVSVFLFREFERGGYGIMVGGVTGYETDIIPMAGFYIDKGPLRFNLLPGVVSFSLGF